MPGQPSLYPESVPDDPASYAASYAVPATPRPLRWKRQVIFRAQRDAISLMLAAQCPPPTIRAMVRIHFGELGGSMRMQAINRRIKRAQAENCAMAKEPREVVVANMVLLYKSMIFGRIEGDKRVEPDQAIVKWAAEGLRKLLGLDAPMKLDLGGSVSINFAAEERAQRMYFSNPEYRAALDTQRRLEVAAAQRAQGEVIDVDGEDVTPKQTNVTQKAP